MGAAGSSHRRSYYPPPPSPGVAFPDDDTTHQSSDPYTLSGNASVHTPRIVQHGAPYMDRSEQRFAVKQHPSKSKSQTHSAAPHSAAPPPKNLPSSPHSRTSFQCNQSPSMQAQHTQTSPPQSPLPMPITPAPPYRTPAIESCNCKACQEKNAAMSATYATPQSAANATYVVQVQRSPQQTTQSTSVAMRTGIPSSTCTGGTKSGGAMGGAGGGTCGGSSSVYATAPQYQQQQQQQHQRMATDRGGIINTCGSPNCRGHAMDPSMDSAMPPGGQCKNMGYDGSGPGFQMQEPPMGRQGRMQTHQADPASYYDRGISPSGGTAPIDVVSEFHHECLEAHNRCRARHQNCPPLSLSSELSKYAQQWAKHLASSGRLEHRQVHTYGENLYTSRGMAVDGATVVQSWYDEIRYYDFSKPNYKPGTGHFTQIVWRDSRQLGVGIATRGDTTYVVCNYNPPGNIIGSFDSMVPPLR